MKELPAFNSARIKVNRAVDQLNGLQLEFKRFYDGKPYRITNECDFDTGEKLLVYYPIPIPDKWLAIVGEILYDLRSALDHVVYELTIWETGSPLNQTEFPVFKDKARFAEVKNDGTPAPKSGL